MNLSDIDLSRESLFVVGVTASFVASLGTGAGALPVFGISRVSQRMQDVLMSIAAGIMLAATMFSLVAPALEAAEQQTGGARAASAIVGVSILLGAWLILLVHRHAPHEHLVKGKDNAAPARLRRAWLFVIALTLHNFPEGMAVGVGFGGDLANGLTVMTGIFIQNMPEGFVVALALLANGYSRSFAALVACGTGLVETLGGLVGAGAVSMAAASLPWAMGISAGAMLFVVSHEIVPETHRNGYEVDATFGVIAGFIGLLILGAVFGA